MELDEGDKQLLRRGMDQLRTANAIMRFLSDHFRDKYGLTPQNEITPDGRIVTSVGENILEEFQLGKNSKQIDLSDVPL